MTYEIPEDLLKAIADYLSSRPYREVAQAMEALMKLKAIPPTGD